MNLARDIAKELVGMFVADARLSVSILFLVPTVGVLAAWLSPLLAGEHARPRLPRRSLSARPPTKPEKGIHR